MICSSCNKYIDSNNFSGGLCHSCGEYFKNGGTINPLPAPGTIEYDYRGYVVCHICGKAYKKLGAHTYMNHNLTISEYKEMFGLCNNAKTTEQDYSRRMHTYALQHNMDSQLRRVGYNTRIRPGDTHLRLGKAIRLQECINKYKSR